MDGFVFARTGWMKRYHGPQPNDPKPIGGGSYNRRSLGHEAFNFLPLNGRMLAYFQPRLQPVALRGKHPSTIALERITPGFSGDMLERVLVIFVATDPRLGGQRIVGWFQKATAHRHGQPSKDPRRNGFSYFIETTERNALLLPEGRRSFVIPSGKAGFGQANVCYSHDPNGHRKQNASWMDQALEYVSSYELENVTTDPESEADDSICDTIGSALERSAGFQSDPKIRRAIEEYAMRCAEMHLRNCNLNPQDTHKTKPYDFLCMADGRRLYVEVKGTQGTGQSVSLTPNEVTHAYKHKNSMLFVVHSVRVKGRRKPVVSGGTELIVQPWDIRRGKLKPRGYVFTLP